MVIVAKVIIDNISIELWWSTKLWCERVKMCVYISFFKPVRTQVDWGRSDKKTICQHCWWEVPKWWKLRTIFLSYTELSHMCMCNSKIWLLIWMVKWVRWDELMLHSLLVKMKKDRSPLFHSKRGHKWRKNKTGNANQSKKKHLKTYTWKWTCEGRGGKQINLTRKGDRENCKYTHMLMRVCKQKRGKPKNEVRK